MIQNDDGPTEDIVAFFKSVMNKEVKPESRAHKRPYKKLNMPIKNMEKVKSMPFEMIVSQIRRNYMITALNVERSSKEEKMKDKNAQEKGQNVMNAFRKLWERKLMKKIKEERKIEMRKKNKI